MNSFGKDLEYAWRTLRRSPGFASIAVLTLALGAGANTAIFSVVDSVLLRPLAYDHPERVVVLGEKKPCCVFAPTSAANFIEYQRRNRSFAVLAASWGRNFILTGRGEPLWLNGQTVTANFFDVFGVRAMRGRTLDPKLDGPGLSRSAVLSYGAWKTKFAGDPRIVGATVTLSGSTCNIVGVMPAEFRSPSGRADLWVSARYAAPEFSDTAKPEFLTSFNSNYMRPMGLLKPGVTLAQAQAEFDSLSQQLEREHPSPNAKKRARLEPVLDFVVGNVRPALWTLLGAVGLVLLIACSNVANLLLARGSIRQREIALRASLGAGRLRIARQLLTESALISFLGGALGLVFAYWLVVMLGVLRPATLPRMADIRVNPEVFLFALGVAIFTGLVSGVAPAVRAARTDLNVALKQGARSMLGAQGQGLRRGLVIAEIALSLTLLTGAGLLIRSFARLLDVSPGFQPDHVVTALISIPPAKYDSNERLAAFFDRLTARVASLPGVTAAGGVDALPFSGSQTNGDISVEGRPKPKPGDEINAEKRIAIGDYFQTLRIPLLRGRYFEAKDAGLPVVIINQNLAKFAFPNEDPIGKRINWGGDEPWMTIVGVVGNVHQFNVDERPTLDTYVPFRQYPTNALTIALRTAGDPASFAAQIRAEVAAIDKDQPVASVDLLADLVSKSFDQRRFQMSLIGALAALALVLASIGIYGVISYAVASRTQEIGVRVAVGATGPQVLRLVLRGALSMTLIGIAVGMGLSMALGRLIASLLYNTGAIDPAAYAGAAGVLLAVALVASWAPAARAARLDPARALREE